MTQKSCWKKVMAWLVIFCLSAGILPTGQESILVAAAAEENTASARESGWLYRICDDGFAEITGYAGERSFLTIPSALGGAHVTRIAENALRDHKELKEITVPAAISEIGASAFPADTVVLHAANGTQALRYALDNDLLCVNTSEYDFFDDILDLSEMSRDQFDLTGNLLTVDAPYGSQLHTGMKVFLPPVTGYEHGMPAEILSLTASGANAAAVIRVLDFSETVETYHAENVTLFPDYSNAIILAEGFTLIPSRTRALDTIQLENSFGVSYEAPRGFRLEGTIALQSSIQMDVDYEWFNIVAYRHDISNTVKANLSFIGDTGNMAALGSKVDDKIDFAKVPMVSAGLLTAWMDLSLVVQMEGTVTLEASVTAIDHMEWKKGQEVIKYSSSIPGETAISVAAAWTGGVQASAVVRLGFGSGDLALDIVSLSVLAGMEAKMETSSKLPGCIDVPISAKITGNFKLGILNDDKPRVALTMKLFDLTIPLKTWHVETDPIVVLDRCTKLCRIDICAFTDYEPESIDVEKNSALPSLSKPVRKGYTFTGWYLDEQLTQPVTSSFRITEDIVIYAGWKKEIPATPKPTNTPAPTATLPPPTPTPPVLDAEGSLPYLTWSNNGTAITITGFLNDPESLTIPSYIDGLPVTLIGQSAFEDCLTLRYVAIPGTVENIRSNAFDGCTSLSSVVLHDGLKRLSSFAFRGCKHLTSVHLPDTVEILDALCFGSCTSLSSINIPVSLKSVSFIYGSGPFYGSPLLTHFTVPEGMTHLPSGTFKYMSDLKSVSLPSTLTSIGSSAFYDCTSLEFISLPSGLTSLGNGAFENCRKLRSIYIPSGITVIPDHCFSGCTMLETITLPSNLKRIEMCGFEGSQELQSIHLPDGIEELGTHAFGNCINLQSVNIPLSLKKVGTYPSPFQSCSKLTSISIPEGMVNLPARLFQGMASLQHITLPSSLKTIGAQAFDGCTNLKDVDLPIGLKTIGEAAFENCDSFVNVTVPEGVTHIYANAFGDCSKMANISLPDGLIYIGLCAINACSSLISIHLPDSVEELGPNAIGNNASLMHVNIPLSLKTVDRYTPPFYNCPQLKHIDITDGMTALPNYLFKGTSSITSVTLPTTLKSIGAYTFSGTNIIEINLPEGFTTFGQNAFAGCKLLQEISIPKGVTFIPTSCFDDCTSLSAVNLPEGLTEIASYAFRACKAMTSVHLPDSIEYLGDRAFGSNPALMEVNIPMSLTQVYGYYSPFENCPNLTSITFPDGKTNVPASMFYYMKNLKEITLPDTIDTIGNSAFKDSGVQILYTPVRGSYAATWFAKNYPNVTIIVTHENMCSVKFDSQGGTLVSGRRVGIGMPVPEPIAPVREEYTFTGWYKDKSCTKPWNFATDTAPSTGLTLYAGWKYSPTQYIFEVTGGTATIVAYIGSASYITLPDRYEDLPVTRLAAQSIPECVRSIHIPASITQVDDRAFRSAANLSVITVAEGHSIYLAEDGVLYTRSGELHSYPRGKGVAEFTPIDGTHTIAKYAIVANRNLRTLNLPATIHTLDRYAISGCEGLRRINFASDMTTMDMTCLTGNSSGMRLSGPADASTLIAYADLFHIPYNEFNLIFMEGLSLLGATTVRAGKFFTPPTPEGVTELTFRGWSIKANEFVPWDFTSQPMPSCDLTLYAFWSLDFTVTPIDGGVALSGYSGSSDPVIVPESVDGAPVLAIAPDTFPNPGVTLKGNKGSVTDSFAAENGMNFEPFTYTVTFAANGGSQPAAQQLCATDTIAQPECRRTGYTLSGWYTDAALTQIWDFATDRMPAGKLTLYAAWTRNENETADEPFTFETAADGVIITGYAGENTELTIPVQINGIPVIAIADRAFIGSSLQQITIADTVTQIGASAFENCRSLISVALPGSVTAIGSRAFAGCKSLRTVSLPGQMITLESGLFEGCTYLHSVSLPSALETISENAFRNCSYLSTVNLGAKVSSVDASAFSGCSHLTGISVSEDNIYFRSEDGVLMSSDGFLLVLYPAGKTSESYTVPEGVLRIGNGAMNQSLIRTLTLPSTLNSIGDRALYSSLRLSNVNFDACTVLYTIGSSAFSSCNSLQTAVLPDSLQSLGANAFSGCQLTSLTVPADTLIGTLAIPAVQDLCITGVAGSDAERYATQYGIRFVDPSRDIPVESITAAESATLTIGQSWQIIPAFTPENTTETRLTYSSANRAVASVTENGLVTARGEGSTVISITAQNGCVVQCTVTVERPDDTPVSISLERSTISMIPGITVPLQAIVQPADSNHTLIWTSSDETVAIYRNGCIVSLSEGTATLTAATPNGLTASCTITVCKAMEPSDLQLPAALVHIDAEAFMGTTFTCVELPGNVLTIGARAFADCTNLQQVLIPSNVTQIDSTAFSGCTQLTIYGTAGSYAEIFAKEQGIPFVAE